MSDYEPCGYTWADGWADVRDPHRCRLARDHRGDHRCGCDGVAFRTRDGSVLRGNNPSGTAGFPSSRVPREDVP